MLTEIHLSLFSAGKACSELCSRFRKTCCICSASTWINTSLSGKLNSRENGKDYYSPTADTDKRKTISGNLNLEYKLNKNQVIGGRVDVNTLSGLGITNMVTEIFMH